MQGRDTPIPYVKLMKEGVEIKMPEGLSLTDESKEILNKGEDKQGFIYFVDLSTKKIHLLAATNPEKLITTSGISPQGSQSQLEEKIAVNEDLLNSNKTKLKKLYSEQGELSELLERVSEKPQQAQPLLARQAELDARIQALNDEIRQLTDLNQKLKANLPKKLPEVKVTMPTARQGQEPYTKKQYATTTREKTSQTGGAGNGDLHANGQRILGFEADSKLLAGGFWIKRENNSDRIDFLDFRTRSTANTKMVELNPLYKFVYHNTLPEKDRVGHTQIYRREIPKVFLEPILTEFLQASDKAADEDFRANVKKSLSFEYLQGGFNKIDIDDKDPLLDENDTIDKDTILLWLNDEDQTVQLYWMQDGKLQNMKIDQEEFYEATKIEEGDDEDKILQKVLATYDCKPTISAIPDSTRLHLAIESTWQLSSQKALTTTFDTISQISKTEVKELIEAFFDKNFPENQKLLETLFKYIKDQPSKNVSIMVKSHFDEVVNDLAINGNQLAKNYKINSSGSSSTLQEARPIPPAHTTTAAIASALSISARQMASTINPVPGGPQSQEFKSSDLSKTSKIEDFEIKHGKDPSSETDEPDEEPPEKPKPTYNPTI